MAKKQYLPFLMDGFRNGDNKVSGIYQANTPL